LPDRNAAKVAHFEPSRISWGFFAAHKKQPSQPIFVSLSLNRVDSPIEPSIAMAETPTPFAQNSISRYLQ